MNQPPSMDEIRQIQLQITMAKTTKLVEKIRWKLSIFDEYFTPNQTNQTSINLENEFMNSLITLLEQLDHDDYLADISILFKRYLVSQDDQKSSLLQTQIINNLKYTPSLKINLFHEVTILNCYENDPVIIEWIQLIKGSKLIQEYINKLLGNQIQPQYQIEANVQFQYFDSLDKSILAIVLFNGQILLNCRFQPKDQSLDMWKILLLTHCEITARYKRSFMIYSSSEKYPFIESEIFGLRLDFQELQTEKLNYFYNKSNWNKENYFFHDGFKDIQYVKNIECRFGILQTQRQYNILTDKYIKKINNLLTTPLQPSNSQKSKLDSKYITLQYLQVLSLKINQTINQKVMNQFKEITPFMQFQTILDLRSSLDLLLSSEEFFKFIVNGSESAYVNSIIFSKQKAYYRQLDPQDIDFINEITNTEQIIQVFKKSFELQGINCILNQEYECCSKYIKCMPIIVVCYSDAVSFTLMNGQIAMDYAHCFHRDNAVTDALRRITMIHELYFNNRRWQFAHNHYLEMQIFGKTIQNLIPSEAYFILDLRMWKNYTREQFLEKFQELTMIQRTPQLQDINQKTQNIQLQNNSSQIQKFSK